MDVRVSRRDTVRNEHIRGTIRVTSKKITEKRRKWYGYVRRTKEEYKVRRIIDADITVKVRIWRPKIGWKHACQRDLTNARLKGQHNKHGIM